MASLSLGQGGSKTARQKAPETLSQDGCSCVIVTPSAQDYASRVRLTKHQSCLTEGLGRRGPCIEIYRGSREEDD